MDTSDFGYLTYLVLLLAAVVFWFVTNHRESFGKTVQQAMAWGLIILGTVAVVALWDDIRGAARPAATVFADENRIEVPRGPDGHFHLTLEVNGAPVSFLVDTGATDVILSRDVLGDIGIKTEELDFIGRAMTANGEVRTAPVRLKEVVIGDFRDTNIRAWVNDGEMDTSLLGMSYLQRYEQITIARGKLVLTR